MLTEEEKDHLREEKIWARENILFINSKLAHIERERGRYLSVQDYWRTRHARADRTLAFEEKLTKIKSEKDMSPLARILRDKKKAKELMELLRLAKKEVEENED